ncbi:MAG: adenylate kinase [Bacteroidota bacterium]|nr:adenylate kinase [Bacteroidota bacterium]
MLNIALFGPPGAGKGTQSKFLIQKYNLFYISTGDILRKELKEESVLGLQAKNIIEAGGLVSDEIIVQIIEKTITDNSDARGFLFDGFPRTFVQAYILEGLMIKLNSKLNILISIEVSEEESVKRLLKRGLDSGRSDDNEEVIKNRLKEYYKKTLPVLDFYKEKGNFTAVNGLQSVKDVNTEIEQVIDNLKKSKLVNIIMFGYPGSGRGTLGKAATEKYGLEFIATGAMLESEIKNNTAIGKQILDMYENGELVPDEIVIKLLEKRLDESKNAKGFIFKGYPRTLVQSYILDEILQRRNTAIDKVYDVDVETLELVDRLDKRSRTDKRMPYDSSTTRIVKRLKAHKEKTLPVIKKYEESHSFSVINGMDTFENVFNALCSDIEKTFKNIG